MIFKNKIVFNNKNNKMPGYPTEIFLNSDTLTNLICPICWNIIKNPVGTTCKTSSHIFCQECLLESIKYKSQCPTCRCRITGDTTKYKVIHLLKNMIDSLPCKCIYDKCKWKGLVIQLEKHLNETCIFHETKCPNEGCEEQCDRKIMKFHNEACSYKKVICLLCKKTILEKDELNHVKNDCDKIWEECTACHKFMYRTLIKKHNKFGCSYAEETNTKCPCGNILSTACIDKKCVKCCQNINCKRHKKIVVIITDDELDSLSDGEDNDDNDSDSWSDNEDDDDDDSDESHKCSNCGTIVNYYDFFDYGYSCGKCHKDYCGLCRTGHEMFEACKTKDCKYCKKGHCHNNKSYYVCDSCFENTKIK